MTDRSFPAPLKLLELYTNQKQTTVFDRLVHSRKRTGFNYELTESFNALPALKLGTRAALISIGAPV